MESLEIFPLPLPRTASQEAEGQARFCGMDGINSSTKPKFHNISWRFTTIDFFLLTFFSRKFDVELQNFSVFKDEFHASTETIDSWQPPDSYLQ